MTRIHGTRTLHRAALTALLLGAYLVVPAPASAAACAHDWGSAPKSGGGMHLPGLFRVIPSTSACWDRLTFTFAGSVNGYRVRYGETYTEGEGRALSPYTAGGALLNVTLLAPAQPPGFTVGTGAHAVNAIRYRTLRDGVFGGSFEGQSTFAVGVRARLPFRVFTAAGPGGDSRIILDVLHAWPR
ncbi:hypothetical protein GCM10010124_23430 [Pilimelia terevasa]|uniref:AMIN-like domain-containing protein n=1 Tax=Pilimelia terevasa TaxID=53372 RepID=A0A8J3BQY8_9ACTN|nr:hypothetical protein [Pilimelia terevasa]GGK29993.1 hypothetical protein GCM10010124_23430 [Pilimelia terevasa]